MEKPDINTLSMGLLFTIFITLGISFLGEMVFHIETPEKKGYLIEVANTSADDAGVETIEPEEESILALLASADIGAGEKLAKQRCSACHVFDAGGENKNGPQLYNIVNREIGSVDGFGYSSALAEYGAGKNWSFEELDGFLKKPSDWIKGTIMGFAGLKKAEERAEIIAYMRTLSDAPAPLPDQ